AGILQAVAAARGRRPRGLYGDNTYYEAIQAAQQVAQATPSAEATAHDWEAVDLLLAQFNPTFQRLDGPSAAYPGEPVVAMVHQALRARHGHPLTLALDGTLDVIDSPRVGHLLAACQDAIAQGRLNVICYRSGVKYDLFGMDHYCGAPCYMIHNRAAHWA